MPFANAQINPVSPKPRQMVPVVLAAVDKVSSDEILVVASFATVAARACRNKWARQRLQAAVRAVIDAAGAVRRDEVRTLATGSAADV
jgi:glutamate racemase